MSVAQSQTAQRGQDAAKGTVLSLGQKNRRGFVFTLPDFAVGECTSAGLGLKG